MSSLSARSGRSSTGSTAGLNDPGGSLAATGSQVDLSVGAMVVYGGYGLGRVACTRDRGTGQYSSGSVVLEFAGGLSVTLPRERAIACLRSVADQRELARVENALRHDNATVEKSWQARTRNTRTKIAAGDPVGLAEVVREAVTRQRTSASGALSMYENELYLKARRLLVAELGVATATDEVRADAWVDSQLEVSADRAR
jgi:RNA polymerase-interacting CarD/CdnL/TRCF family regulator